MSFCECMNSLKIKKVHEKSLNVVLNHYLSPYHVLFEKAKRPTMCVSMMRSIDLDVLNASISAVRATTLLCIAFPPLHITDEVVSNY